MHKHQMVDNQLQLQFLLQKHAQELLHMHLVPSTSVTTPFKCPSRTEVVPAPGSNVLEIA